MDLNEHGRECYRISEEHGWYEDERSFGDLTSLFHSEISEAFEAYRHGFGTYKLYWECQICGLKINTPQLHFSAGNGKTCRGEMKPEGIPVELMDCVIRILDWFGRAEQDTNGRITAEYIMRIKSTYNETRPMRHGGKVL